MPRSMADHPRTTAKDIPDRDLAKQFPTGISSVILGLQYFWYEVAHGGKKGLVPEEFCVKTGFDKVYGAEQERYPKRQPRVDHTKPESLGKVVHRLVNQKRDIDFLDMRAFAELVGLPTGLFLLFSQCVSDERRCGSDRETACTMALELIKAIRRVIDVTEGYIKERPSNKPMFVKVYDATGEKHIADVSVLKMWADAFKAGDYVKISPAFAPGTSSKT